MVDNRNTYGTNILFKRRCNGIQERKIFKKGETLKLDELLSSKGFVKGEDTLSRKTWYKGSKRVAVMIDTEPINLDY